MNRVFLFPKEFADVDDSGAVIIHDPLRTKHVQEILKAKIGDEIKIVVINQGLGKARILAIKGKTLELRPGPLSIVTPPKFNDEIWIGACRPQTVKKIFEYATSMGVSSIRFFKAELTEKSYLTSKIFKAENQENHLALGLAQSGIYFQMPQVIVSAYFPCTPPPTPALLFSTSETSNLFARPLPFLKQRMTLVFGPERGLTLNEESAFLKMGMTPVNIHPSTLRIEVALISALSQLHAQRFFLA